MRIVIGSDNRTPVTKRVMARLRDQDRELAQSLRLTSQARADEMLEPWFGALPGDGHDDAACMGDSTR